MAEVPSQDAGHVSSEEEEVTPGYKAPAQVSLQEIAEKDKDDESLQKYKKTLLGGDVSDIVNKDGPNVAVEKMALLFEGRVIKEIDLTGDLSKIKDKPFVVKEGAEFRIRVTFRVNREIVSGLRYFQATYRKGIRVDKSSFMVGSYGPKSEPHEYLTAVDEAPKGMIARGHYNIKSKFIDDDKNIYLEWEWAFDVKKEWE